MKTVIWKTGHPIADTVADAFMRGASMGDSLAPDRPVNIAYGILRGNDQLFRASEAQGKHWFEVDRGYFDARHFDGYYRISYKGTQALFDKNYPIKSHLPSLMPEPIRPYDKTKAVLICPPTDAVMDFFGMIDAYGRRRWTPEAGQLGPFVIRHKGDSSPINWDAYRMVITFNSSVGWEAIRRGIPCLSDMRYSTVGSFYGETLADLLLERFYSGDNRMELFRFMQAHQFTLDEIAQGHAWGLINHYLSRSSAGIRENPSQRMFAPTASAGALSIAPKSAT